MGPDVKTGRGTPGLSIVVLGGFLRAKQGEHLLEDHFSLADPVRKTSDPGPVFGNGTEL